MSKIQITAIAVVSVVAGVVGAGQIQLSAARQQDSVDNKEIIKVTGEDIRSGRAQLIGELGLPIGTIATVRGVWNGKEFHTVTKRPPGFIFEVDTVNGEALDKRATFHERDIRGPNDGKLAPSHGATKSFRVFESVQWVGLPPDAFEDEEPGSRARMLEEGLWKQLHLLRKEGSNRDARK